MTTTSAKPTTRETSAFVRDKGLRPLIVTVHHGLIELRPKGLRATETIDLAAMYYQAVKGRVFRERMEKAKAKKARKGARR
jgi:hypothetical protein